MDIAVKQEVNGSPLPQRQQPQHGGGGGVGPQGPMQGHQGPVGDGPGGNKNNMNRNNRNNSKNRQNMGPNRGNRGGPGGGMGNNGGGGPGGNGGPGLNRQGNHPGNQQNQGGEDGGPQQNQHQNRGMNRGNRGHDMDNSFGERRRGGGGEAFFINDKLRMLAGPLLDIPPIEVQEAKFSGRNRLYVGNLTNDVTEEELVEMFKPFGEIHEVFMNKEKNYAFVRVDFFSNAENAKRELDGTMRKNRVLRVRFAPNATAIRVKNLTPYVTNELLYKAFEVFGPLERAVVQVDERGKPTGEGIVEFKNKPGAMAAIRYCTDKCYFLTSSLRPVIVEPYTYQDDNDGLPEKSLNKKQNEFVKARQQGPRFAEHGSFEFEYGQRWKQMHELFKQKAEALKREMIMEEEKLEAQMEYAKYEQETELLREQLRQREMDRDRKKAEWEMQERQVAEARQRNDLQLKTDIEEMNSRIKRTDEELHRRQKENTMFMQQNQQMTIMEQQQMNDMGGMGGGSGGGGGGGNGNDNRRNFDMMNQSGGNGNFGNMFQEEYLSEILRFLGTNLDNQSNTANNKKQYNKNNKKPQSQGKNRQHF
ncbi:hrp65 protein-like isoform X3 [Anopheles coustani]|uniref:hrp65 protein-like isoform X3 n=1 Tax=Anopheles coustani TaxID=139045 RepID=UPI0026596179|nr:hrp65 protein-like isoform X3 [Anopheles coustani]XP_058129786.1 hrp65 protein-like isoform X3 [Anopheles coustani]XP_058129787.1 hrp65 protein-like isoform X3 [Anopheles coustani]XP_058129788.1 hrp65 protein-like isoform X3 [Anopheles coustani]XP_058129790.1 hrp65 protein-like isoform X3 [Anopheles coustani]XP_058129791.1 hrp65 protein-like isoform X3 [Anopheles coustani]